MNNSSILSVSKPIVDYVFPGFGVVISIYALVANLRLLHQQRSMTSWFDDVRPLIVGTLVANALSSLAHLTLFCLTIYQSAVIVSDNIDPEWLLALTDAGCTISATYIAALAIHGFIQIRRCSRSVVDLQKTRSSWIHTGHAGWPIALLLALFGLNADHSAFGFHAPHLASDVVYFAMTTILQLVVLCLLFKTRRLCNELQHDFEINRAQQTLKTRVSLNRTIRRTRILIPQLAINVLLWTCIISVNFVIYFVTTSASGVTFSTSDEVEVNATWAVFMDCVEAMIYGLYPVLLSRRPGSPVKRQVLKAIRCQYDAKEETAVGEVPAITTGVDRVKSREESISSPKKNNAHWQAIDMVWARVEKAKMVGKQKVTPLG